MEFTLHSFSCKIYIPFLLHSAEILASHCTGICEITGCGHAEVRFDSLELGVGFDSLGLGVGMQRWGLKALNWMWAQRWGLTLNWVWSRRGGVDAEVGFNSLELGVGMQRWGSTALKGQHARRALN
jgi:hypothetical protein